MGPEVGDYQETPKGGHKPEGPLGTCRTSEAHRRATKAYRARKVILTLRTVCLQEQVEHVSQALGTRLPRSRTWRGSSLGSTGIGDGVGGLVEESHGVCLEGCFHLVFEGG